MITSTSNQKFYCATFSVIPKHNLKYFLKIRFFYYLKYYIANKPGNICECLGTILSRKLLYFLTKSYFIVWNWKSRFVLKLCLFELTVQKIKTYFNYIFMNKKHKKHKTYQFNEKQLFFFLLFQCHEYENTTRSDKANAWFDIY